MSKRLAHLDGLRGLAALNVVIGHTMDAFDFTLYSGVASQAHGHWEVPLSGSLLLLPAAGQNFSVCIFLVLSGYVLAHVYRNDRLGVAGLAAKRFVRLGIPVLAATMLAWMLLATGLTFHHQAQAVTHSDWLGWQLNHGANVLVAAVEGLFGALIGPWTYPRSYNSSLWTMSVEFAGSLMLIGVVRGRGLLGRFGRSDDVVAGGLLLLAVVLFPTYLSLLAAGAGLQMYGLAARGVRVPGWGALVLLGVGLLLGTVPYSVARGPWLDALVRAVPGAVLPWGRLGPAFQTMERVEVLHGIGAVLLLMAIEWHPGLRRGLAAPVPRWLGTISFPLYLVHLPLLLSVGCGSFLVMHGLGAGYAVAAGVAGVVFLGVALLVASLAVRLLERPAVWAAGWAGAGVQRGVDRLRGVGPERDVRAA